MAEERCEQTELLVDQCGCAKHKRASSGPTWEAMFPAGCRTCGVRIEVGDKVKWTSDGLYPQHSHH